MENTLSWARKPRTQQERIETWLGADDLHELLTAQEALERQGPEADRILRALVQRDAQRCRKGRKQLRVSLLLVGLVVFGLLCWHVGSPGLAGRAALYLLLTFWLLFPCALSWFEDYRTYRRRLNHAVALLHRMPASPAAAAMIDALDVGDDRTSAVAAGSLVQLLPQLTEAEGTVLQAKHHRALRRALRGYNTDLILAILHAGAKILNHTAISDVRWLTNCPDWIAESEKIQTAARKALTELEAKSRRRRSGQTLLRPAPLPDRPAADLLRPAPSVTPIPAHEMLRSVPAKPATVPPKQGH